MSAETLRKAAALMRERARAATPGPWEAFRRGDPGGPHGVCPEAAGDMDADVFDGASRGDAEHIASWGPGVTELAATLLEALADKTCDCDVDEFADDFARAYLGESA